MSWYTPVPVASDLSADGPSGGSGCLVTGWQAQIMGEHRIVPDGSVDVLWIGNGTAWVCGPETAAWTFRLPPGLEAVGVRFQPGRAGAMLGFDTRDLRDRRAPVADLLGARSSRQLMEQLGEAPDGPTRLHLLQRQVRGWVSKAPPPDPVVETVRRMLSHDPATTVATLADTLGRSERALHRRCVTAFGYGPATLRRILRLQRFLALARRPAAPVDLATLATLAGYTDQPHLSRDCRAIAGRSPAELLGRRVRSIHDIAGPGEQGWVA